tara:strand:- start:49 stop:453 length:405 start_codon:yes stop_codon:yes gene_type:complete
MEKILGSWKLVENLNFSEFLIYTQTPWYQRQIAEYSNINIVLTKTGEDMYNKSVDSVFYTQNEDIILDGTEREYAENIKKSYTFNDKSIDVNITGSIVNWTEQIKFIEPNLFVNYKWFINDKEFSASQVFNRSK